MGLYVLITTSWLLMNRQAGIAMIRGMLSDAPLMVLVASITLGLGLAILLGHNVWSGGPLPVLVTVTGWIMLMRGVFLLFMLPSNEMLHVLEVIGFERFFYLYLGIPLVLGAVLTYLGFAAPRRSQAG